MEKVACMPKNFSGLRKLLVMNGLALFSLITNGQSTSNMNNNNSISTSGSGTKTDQNPLLSKWIGNYGGFPPFDKVRVADFKPALKAGMDEQLTEIDKIATNGAAATFENTIAALERAGETLDRVTKIYGIWSGNMNNSEFQVIEREMAPQLAAFQDKITQNTVLFKRIETVYNSPAKKNLTAEQTRLTWRYYTNFVRAGAKLDATAKIRLSQ
jgi:peptidyl-dipeptidase Dcp